MSTGPVLDLKPRAPAGGGCGADGDATINFLTTTTIWPDHFMRRDAIASACFFLALNLSALANEPECHRVADDAGRLKCYDDAHAVAAKSVAAATTVQASTETQNAAADESFGMTQQLRNQDAALEDKAQAKLTAVIAKATASAGGALKLTLDNGQQWTLLEGHRPGEFEAGDKVGIRLGSFGSYRIRNDSGGRILRVRRIR